MGLVWRINRLEEMLPDSRQITYVFFMGAIMKYKKKCASHEDNRDSVWEMEEFWCARIHVRCSLHELLVELGFCT